MQQNPSNQPQAQITGLRLRLNYAPNKQDFFFFVLCEKQLSDIDGPLANIKSETSFRGKIKKAAYIRRINADLSEHKGIPPGDYFAYLFMSYGDNEAGTGRPTIECMEQKLVYKGSSATEVKFSIVSDLACVEIFVKNGSTPLVGADIMVERQPNAFASKGEKPIIVHLPPGTYAVTAIYRDEIVKQRLEISGTANQTLELNFANAEPAHPALQSTTLDRSIFGASTGTVFEIAPTFSVLHDAPEKAVTESLAASAIGEPGILRIENVKRSGGRIVLHQEVFESKSLEEILSAKLAFQEKHFLHVMKSVVQTLANAHQRGVVHRGLHAMHVLIGRQGQVKIRDFGFFSLLETTMDTNPSLKTLLSPEQISSYTSDIRTDVFFIAKLLFLLVTGKAIYATGNGPLNFLEHEIITQLTDAKMKVPAEIKAWTAKGLAIDPSKRPQDLSFLLKTFLSMS